jgi:hypothetical protein
MTLIGDVGTGAPGPAINWASSNRSHWIRCPRYQPASGSGAAPFKRSRAWEPRGTIGRFTICDVSTSEKPDRRIAATSRSSSATWRAGTITRTTRKKSL